MARFVTFSRSSSARRREAMSTTGYAYAFYSSSDNFSSSAITR
ncbi:hypothetical protein [Nostoc sp.]